MVSIEDFLRHFRGLNRRAVRDVGDLGVDAERWSPPTGDGENAWGIGQIVSHMATSRVFFAGAYAEGRWHAEQWSGPVETSEQWVAAHLQYCQSANGEPDGDSSCSSVCSRQSNPAWDPYRVTR